MYKQHTNYQPWEKAFDRILTPYEEFIHDETASGLILMACTLVALFLANGFLHEHYEHLLHTEIALSLGGWELRHTLHHWINDGLMALFFMVVGLEIKREVVIGELSDPKAAVLPIVAAVGGMVVPAALFYLINAGGPGANGWGVPMATDIAFAVGVLVLLGSRIPKTVLIFLVGLAIVDDLGAVLVIAVLYTEQIAADWLAVAGLTFVLLVALNRIGVRKPLPYFLVGILMWFAMLQSGVHATLAGVPVAIHLDHGAGLESAMQAVNLGCNGVMVDSSDRLLVENIRRTREVTAMAHGCGVPVEGELGYVPGVEGEDAERHPGEIAYTSVEDARAYVQETQVDFLAVPVGTVHGRMRGTPELNLGVVQK